MAAAVAAGEPGDDCSISKEDYYVVDGMRLVKPYHFNFKCRVKERWMGRDVLDVFLAEFPSHDREYYERALKEGRLKVEDTRKNKSWKGGPLEDGQCIRHYIHRHEPPALPQLPEVLDVTETVVAVNKPPTLPVHTSGQYRKNTVQALVELHNPELGPLYSVHRLDKTVSGVLLFARSPASARVIQSLIIGGSVEKVYVARVMGIFPDEERTVEVYLDWDPKMNKAVVVDKPVDASYSIREKKGPKFSETEVRLLKVAEDGQTSIVECRPRTGRTHQIRIHLEHLGFPIANDYQYGGTMAKNRPNYDGWRFAEDTNGTTSSQDEVQKTEMGKAEKLEKHLSKYPFRVDDDLVDPLCPHCPAAIPVNYPVNLEPIWLHATSYSCEDWSFQSPMPDWA
ncbi:hypothetical protein BSKO_09857 [Bryopsis sp. KO-2023]|nr:hypothetical protein BSKO_09857 [Bryopsis sp. KO-2023]